MPPPATGFNRQDGGSPPVEMWSLQCQGRGLGVQPVRDAGGRAAKDGAGRATGGTARRSRCGGFCRAGDTLIVCVLVLPTGLHHHALLCLPCSSRTYVNTYNTPTYLVYCFILFSNIIVYICHVCMNHSVVFSLFIVAALCARGFRLLGLMLGTGRKRGGIHCGQSQSLSQATYRTTCCKLCSEGIAPSASFSERPSCLSYCS